MDTFFERVHAVDMNGQNKPASNLHPFIAGNIKEFGYGG